MMKTAASTQTSDSLLTLILVLCVMTTAITHAQKGGHVEYPPEENVVILEFQQALRVHQWDKALSLCSDRVRASAAVYVSAEAFFNAVVPVQQIVGQKSFGSWTYQTKRGADITDLKPKDFLMLGHFVRLPNKEPDPEVSWTWTAYKLGDRWIIDFDLKPLWEVIDQETARLKKEAEDARRSAAIGNHVITRVKTRLTSVSQKYVVGQPMLFRLELINECDFDLVYDATRTAFYSMLVTDASGQSVPYIRGPVQTAIHYMRIKAGETAVLFDKLDLGKDYDLSKPGRYKVKFNGRELMIGLPLPKRPGQDNEWPTHSTTKLFPSNIVEIHVGTEPAK